jgi:hypothetical protein
MRWASVLASICISGCASTGSTELVASPPGLPSVPPRPLAAPAAAALAARLANDHAQRSFGQRPFVPGSYRAEMADNRWRWGSYSASGTGGFSAQVSFTTAGMDPEVHVWFTTDVDETESL